MEKLHQYFWLAVISLTVFVAVTLSAIRMAMPYAERYLGQIEQFASSKLGIDISIGELDSGWQGLGPALRFEDVRVSDPQTGEQISSVQYVDVQLDLFASLMAWDWVLGRLTIDGLVTQVEQPEKNANTLDRVPWQVIHSFKKVLVKNAVLQWTMRKGEPLIFNVHKFYWYPRKGKQRIELNMNIGNPDSRIQLIVDTQGDWMKPKTLTADGFVRLSHLSLDKRYMPHIWKNLNWKEGNIDGDFWFQYDQGEWSKITGHTTLSNFVIRNVDTKERLPFSFSGDLAFIQSAPDQMRFTADDVLLNMDGESSPLNSWVMDLNDHKAWEIKLDAVSLFDAVSVARLFDYLTPDMDSLLTAHEPHALLHHIAWTGVPGDEQHWRLGFKISEGYQKAEDGVPGFDRLSGTVKITPTQGEFEVDSEHLLITAPKVYDKSIEIDKAQGLITWTQNPMVVNTEKFYLSARDASLMMNLNVHVHTAAEASSQIKLWVETSPLTHEDVLYFLPSKVLNPALYQWISDSFKSGDVSVATGRVEGAAKDFPYDNGKGIFELNFALHNGLLDYETGWPPIHDIDAQLVIDAKKFQAYLDAGHYQDTVIKQAVASIDYTNKDQPLVLAISGDTQGPASDAESFLRNSPLWQKLGAGLSWVDVEAVLDTRLNLKIPLDQKTKASAAGIVSMAAGTILLPEWKISFDNVSGAVHFNDGCMSAENIHATFFKHSATISTSCKQQKDNITHAWVLQSAFDESDMLSYLEPRFQALVKGGSTYTATLLTAAGSEASTLTVSSDLKGVSIDAPPTFSKKADESRKTSVTLPLKGREVFTPVVTYDGLVSVGLLLKKEAEKILLKGANIVLGANTAPVPTTEAFNISGKIKSLHIDEWLAYIEKLKTPEESSMNITGNFWVDTLYYKDFRLDQVNFSWKRLVSAWQVMFDGPGAIGQIKIPDTITADDPLSLHFNRYVWRANPNINKHSFDQHPNTLPAINFYCQQFFYKDQPLGEFQFKMRPTANGVVFDPIELNSYIHSVSATGRWMQHDNDPVFTLFQGKAKTRNIGDTLSSAAVKSDIVDSKAEATFDLHWLGSPAAFSLGKVVGDIDLKFGKGRLVAVNPGLGRLLGLFSVESIARRLQFDFSDLFQKGFAFDSFQAKITTANGYAYTNEATLKAPAANMTLTGKMGLVNQSLDMDLDVKSKANSTVSTLGAAAVAIANPFAGAAVWLAGQVFNPLEGVGHYRYHVTGTWQAPVFTDVTAPPKESKETRK